MALSNLTSITDIEEQIAKITAELEKARALQYTTAEKAFLAAQKRTAVAQAKVNDLNAKASTTVAAQSRLALAKTALTEQESLLADVETVFNAAKAEQDAADEFAKNVALVLSGKKLGKKIKLNKKEKAVLKEEKKNAKKIAKQEKKAAKKQAKDEKKKSAELADTPVVATSTATEKPAPKTPVKKAVVKKPVARKAAAVKKIESPVAAEPNEEISTVAEQAPVEQPKDLAVTPSTSESPATETGKDVVVETETLPPSENPASGNSEEPVND